MPLGDGSAIRLTGCRDLTRLPDAQFEKPYEDKGQDFYFNEFEKRFESGGNCSEKDKA